MDLDNYNERKIQLGLDKPIELLIEQAMVDGILENSNCKPGKKFYKNIGKSYLGLIKKNLKDLIELTAFKAWEREVRPKEFLKYSIVFLLDLFKSEETKLYELAAKLKLQDAAELYVGLAAEVEHQAKEEQYISPTADGKILVFNHYPQLLPDR